METGGRDAPPFSARVQELERMLDGLATNELFSGVVLLRTGSDRAVAVRGDADRAQGTLNDAAMRFNVASITKLFTAVAVCRLRQRGLLRFDTPLTSYLPGAPLAQLPVMTVHHLLTHTAGFPEEIPDIPAHDSVSGAPASAWLTPLRGIELLFMPGSDWQYSNVGYAILGAVIEAVTGALYFDAMDSLVFRPAGMTATAFDDPAAPSSPRATGYLYRNQEEGRPDADNCDAGLGRGAPFGYAYSTLRDLERLIDQIGDHAIVTAEHAELILRGAVPTSEPTRTAGYGMFVDRVGNRAVTTTSGAGPGISAWLDFVPELDYLAIVLSNYPKPAAHRVGRFLRGQVL